ncbi:MAG: hypothetical protein ACK6D3_22170 [Planctomycetaceae bacterium]|jgi:hypothetical protein
MPIERRDFLSVIALGFPSVLTASPLLADEPQEPKSDETKPTTSTRKGTIPSQEELDRWFAEKLANSAFAGNYSVTQGTEEKAAVMEKYAISKVSKVNNTTWLFGAKWQIQGKEFPIAVPFQVLWAGKTPVITLDEVTIPGLGTFSARVLIHEDWYAGTWVHGKVGGHLWGRIERGAPTAPANKQNPQ